MTWNSLQKSPMFCIFSFSFYIWGVSIAFLLHLLGGYLGRYNCSTLVSSQPLYLISYRFLLWNIWSPLPCVINAHRHTDGTSLAFEFDTGNWESWRHERAFQFQSIFKVLLYLLNSEKRIEGPSLSCLSIVTLRNAPIQLWLVRFHPHMTFYRTQVWSLLSLVSS